MSIESVMPFNHLIFCHPLLLLPSVFPSIRVFSNELDLRIRWPKYWSFSFSPSDEYSGLISFKIDWYDLLAVQGTPCKFLLVGWLYIPIYICFLVIIINSIAFDLQIILEWMIICAAAAAKSLQSCPTLCDPMDCSPPGSSVHGIFQARVLEWGAIAFSVSMSSFAEL